MANKRNTKKNTKNTKNVKNVNGKGHSGSDAGGRAVAGSAHHGRFLRYCSILLLGGMAVLLWYSLLTFDPNDWPGTSNYPSGPVSNRVGTVGAYISHTLLYWIGGGIYVAVFAASAAAATLLVRRTIRDLPWRILGTAVLTACTSCAIYLAQYPDVVAGEVSSWSPGILGYDVGGIVLGKLAAPGAWIVVSIGSVLGLLLSADRLLLSLASFITASIKQRRQRRAKNLPLPVVASSPKSKPGQSEKPPRVNVAALLNVPKKATRENKPASSPGDAIKRMVSREPVAPAPIKRPVRDESFALPPVDLLVKPSAGYVESQESTVLEKRAVLQQTLSDFNVGAEVVGHMTGPVITMFELSLEPGVKVAAVARLSDDISRALAVPGVRVVSPLPGRDTIGIEVPNMEKETVRIRELMDLVPHADASMHLPLYLGKDAEGNAIVTDLARMPHMLIAGTTGSGKSVCINSIIMAILLRRSPQDVRLILVDPKMVEMAAFESIPHLLCPIVNDMRKAEDILEWAASKMDERYELLKEAGVRDIASFNSLGADKLYERIGVESEEDKLHTITHLPYYVIIVDELADLVMTSSKGVEDHIIRIAQKARAVGIHLILATQRPSANVVTGLIKSNMPCRISFRVASRQESRIVLDQNGAEVLLGQGDMLVLLPGTSNLARAQGTFIDDSEIRSVVKSFKSQGEPDFNRELMKLNSPGSVDGGGEKDDLFNKAVEIILGSGRGSVSLLQRRLSIGYSRSSRIIDQMADAGILGTHKGSQARECLMTLEDWQAFQESIAADQSGRSSFDGIGTSS